MAITSGREHERLASRRDRLLALVGEPLVDDRAPRAGRRRPDDRPRPFGLLVPAVGQQRRPTPDDLRVRHDHARSADLRRSESLNVCARSVSSSTFSGDTAMSTAAQPSPQISVPHPRSARRQRGGAQDSDRRRDQAAALRASGGSREAPIARPRRGCAADIGRGGTPDTSSLPVDPPSPALARRGLSARSLERRGAPCSSTGVGSTADAGSGADGGGIDRGASSVKQRGQGIDQAPDVAAEARVGEADGMAGEPAGSAGSRACSAVGMEAVVDEHGDDAAPAARALCPSRRATSLPSLRSRRRRPSPSTVSSHRWPITTSITSVAAIIRLDHLEEVLPEVEGVDVHEDTLLAAERLLQVLPDSSCPLAESSRRL